MNSTTSKPTMNNPTHWVFCSEKTLRSILAIAYDLRTVDSNREHWIESTILVLQSEMPEGTGNSAGVLLSNLAEEDGTHLAVPLTMSVDYLVALAVRYAHQKAATDPDPVVRKAAPHMARIMSERLYDLLIPAVVKLLDETPARWRKERKQ